MEDAIYIVDKIDGDYAVLSQLETAIPLMINVARALLPLEIEEGTRLLWNASELSYSIIQA